MMSEDFKMSEETAKALGVALGMICAEQMCSVTPAGEEVMPEGQMDCVGIEESTVWEAMHNEYWETDPTAHDICFKQMYASAREHLKKLGNKGTWNVVG